MQSPVELHSPPNVSTHECNSTGLCIHFSKTTVAKHDIYYTKLDESSKYHNVSDDQTEDKEYDGLGDVDLTEEGERIVSLES